MLAVGPFRYWAQTARPVAEPLPDSEKAAYGSAQALAWLRGTRGVDTVRNTPPSVR